MFTPAGIASEIATFAGLIEPELPLIAGAVGVSNADITIVTVALDDLKQTAAAFAAADGPEMSAPLINRIEIDANTVMGKLTAMPLPPSLAMPVRIASMLLPVAITAAKLLTTPAT